MLLVPPNRIVIDFLEGVTNRADAIAYARGFITSHFEVPEQSGYYVQALKDGYAYEVHEGGSRKAFLPSILRVIEDTPEATVSVRSGTRVLQVSKSGRGTFNSVMLPEELSSYLENVVEPDAKAPNLTPFQMDNVVWLFVGVGVGLLGALVFILNLAFFALDPSQAKLPVYNITETDKLPLAQWQRMVTQLDGNNFISAMRFENGNWRFDLLNNTANSAPPPVQPPAAPTTPANVLPPLPPALDSAPVDAPVSTGPIVMTPNETVPVAPVPPPSDTGMPASTP
ncbi:MAG TPA: hypothetical protein PKW15_00085 [Alphaproteobacteria bacterium]|nr:hypothetical protein [Rhodospirillaceae bacterium]HRJ11622.1 hypothetical protein [Alphaproteobacteria bacterium]